MSKFWLKSKILATILFIGLFLVSFSQEKQLEINISGSTTMYNLMSELSKIYCFENPKMSINIEGTGSGKGFRDLISGRAELALMSRGLKEHEKSILPDGEFNLIQLARDGVMPVVSDEIFVYLQALTLKQIADIYSGKIKNWKQLNGPDKEIFVIDKIKSSGTRSVYMKALFNNSKANAEGADTIVETTAQEAELIRNHTSAIGMLSNAWLDDEVKGISVIMGRKLMRPQKGNIDKGIYPIIRPLNLLTNIKVTPEIQDFLNYIQSKKGLEIIESQGYSIVRN